MKSLLSILFLSSITLFCQENPWEPKKTENPWKTEAEKKTVIEKDTTSIKPAIDSIPATRENEEALIEDLKMKAQDHYKAGGDFAVGFGSGLVFSFGGSIVSALYSIPNNKQEKQLIETMASDSTFAEVDNDKVREVTKKSVKNKKMLYAILGAFTGAATQVGVLIAIVFLSF